MTVDSPTLLPRASFQATVACNREKNRATVMHWYLVFLHSSLCSDQVARGMTNMSSAQRDLKKSSSSIYSCLSATPTTSPLFQGFSSVWIFLNCTSISSSCGHRNIRTVQFIPFYHYCIVLESKSILRNESFHTLPMACVLFLQIKHNMYLYFKHASVLLE